MGTLLKSTTFPFWQLVLLLRFPIHFYWTSSWLSYLSNLFWILTCTKSPSLKDQEAFHLLHTFLEDTHVECGATGGEPRYTSILPTRTCWDEIWRGLGYDPSNFIRIFHSTSERSLVTHNWPRWKDIISSFWVHLILGFLRTIEHSWAGSVHQKKSSFSFHGRTSKY